MAAPEAWKNLLQSTVRGPILIIGGPDTGKSTLASYLAEGLRRNGEVVALIDADPGQGTLGPPTTLSLRIGESEACKRWFVGATSPSGHMLDQLAGVVRLTRYAQEQEVDTVLIDTCGLIERAAGGHALKWAEFQLLQPATVIALQREEELDPLLAAFHAAGKRVVSLPPAPAARQRDQTERARRRRETFHRYFEGAGDLPLSRESWSHLRTARDLPHGLLLGLLARDGFLLGLGLLLERSDGLRRIRSPLPSLDDVAHILPGEIVVDPVAYDDRRHRR